MLFRKALVLAQLWNGYGTQLKDQFGQSVGIGINVPIFNGWQATVNC